jgi:murein DD-endopeptidase MepM/ murein hydrolase activator NlpD
MIRPVDAEISQRFGDNPTRNLPASSWLIQTFGNYQPDGHTGEDYACPVGTPVRAVADGTVLHIGWMGGTYDQNPWWIQPSFAGYHAVIDHGSFIGIYGHCSDGSAKVAKGARVSEGQVFILSGNTGGSTGPHLHFEILPDGWVLNSTFYGRIDPEPLFATTITTQSATTTPIQEEDIMASVEDLKNTLLSAEVLEAIGKAVHTRPVPYFDPETGQDTGTGTNLAVLAGASDFQHSATRRVLASAAGAIVDAVKAAQPQDAANVAQAAYDEFMKKLDATTLKVGVK